MISRLIAYLSDRECRAGGLVFLLNALIFSNWAVRIPYFKSTLGLTNSEIGKALLFSPLGVIVVAPISVWLMKKYGLGRMNIIFAILLSSSAIGFAMSSNFYALCIAFLFYGLCNGALDVATNAYITEIERYKSGSIISVSHGFWSLGAMLGSLMGSWLVGAEASMWLHMSLTASIGIVLALSAKRGIWTTLEAGPATSFRWKLPAWWAVILSVFIFVIFMLEGAISDWSALFYKEILKVPPYQIGIGFAGYAGTMAIARFYGDAIIDRFVHRNILMIASVGAGLAIVLLSISDHIATATMALMVCGAFCSVLVPLVLKMAARIKGAPSSLSIAFVATMGYWGFLVGPPLMGWLSDATTLPLALKYLGILTLLASAMILITKNIAKANDEL